jgi:DNA-binding NarL/FixJ family response regulator
MDIIIFSVDTNIIDKLKMKIKHTIKVCYDIEELFQIINENKNIIIIADFDSVNKEINNLFKNNILPNKFIILEKAPDTLIGKKLILKGVKAYGNIEMLPIHLNTMINTVEDNKIWTYPELTIKLSKQNKIELSNEVLKLLNSRLSKTEINIVYLILKGYNNNAISKTINITLRNVKSHITSIFKKLHTNDRISLILLLKS